MRIAILCGGDGWHVRDLLRAAVDLGHTAEPVDFRRLGSAVGVDSDLDRFAAVVVRTMPPGSLEQVVFRMDMLHALAQRGVPILNPPRALEICVDKYLALVRMQQAGLRVPDTIVCQHADAALAAFEKLGRDVVVKPIFGSEGRGMMRITDPELAWRSFRAIERTQSVLYLQRFIKHPGWDLRAFVLNGRVVASIRRVATNDWRTNVAQGALAEATTLSPHQEQLALHAAAAVGTHAAGVDLLPGPDGEWYVIEVNAVPGWRALSTATGIDIARAMLQSLHAVPANFSRSAAQLNRIAHLACLWEATARKAGNVHPGAHFTDVNYGHFALSAALAAPEIARAPERSLGETILAAVRATRSAVNTNTNLGIVLLLAPFAKAWGDNWRDNLRLVLRQSTVADAGLAYEAIRLARPGGLGTATEQDVQRTPTQTLREVMLLAADRDLIARQYAHDFADVFELGVPALLDGLQQYGRLEPAIQHCQLTWLAGHADTLIMRKRGTDVAVEASRRARQILDKGGIAMPAGQLAYAEFDDWLRADGHARNPGATADLITACLFVALREHMIEFNTPM